MIDGLLALLQSLTGDAAVRKYCSSSSSLQHLDNYTSWCPSTLHAVADIPGQLMHAQENTSERGVIRANFYLQAMLIEGGELDGFVAQFVVKLARELHS